ncbi:MAG: TRAP transporter permease [Actinomycetes bacterium]
MTTRESNAPEAEELDDPARERDAGALAAELDEELPARDLSGAVLAFVTGAAFAISLFVVNQVFRPLTQGNQYYLILFLAGVLPITYLSYRGGRRGSAKGRDGDRDNPGVLDWVLAAVSLVVCLYPVLPVTIGEGGGGFNAFLDRQGTLAPIDIVMGGVLLVLILEATRRTTGLVLPAVCLGFLAYSYYGGFLPTTWDIAHAGLDFSQIINALYNDQSGFFGVPLDVAATYIVLFTIYGAVLDMAGAGRFFIDLSFSTFRKSRSAPGRTVAMSGFLLGTVSGSGTATAVSLGSVTWPILRKAGYPRENAAGMLAASGVGAILSPPTLGAAAFIIAEYLQTSYLDVLIWAIVPTLLYYLGILLAVEIDARRFGARAVDLPHHNPLRLLLRYGYHFLSLAVIVVFLALDIPPFRAVVYAVLVAVAFAFVETLVSGRRDDDGHTIPLPTVLGDFVRRLYLALAQGVRGVLPVAAVCAAAGIITSTITKTGLGQELASALVSVANAVTDNPTGVLILTAVLAAVAVTVLGLAVPVTASFIISWVVIGPALFAVGVDRPEAAMFIFYYAVLSEASPPTALAAVAAAAITGGDVIKSMWQTCKYALPAFLVPLAFVLTTNGSGLLSLGSFTLTVWTSVVAAVAVAALAVVTGGWMLGPAARPERLLCVPAALLLLYLEPLSVAVGLGFLAAAVAVHVVRRGRTRTHAEAST